MAFMWPPGVSTRLPAIRYAILAQPKVYGFDSGFVCHARRWDTLREDDCGQLWEHLVLETLQSIESVHEIRFWRDKSQREVDFVLPRARDTCDAIECKWSSESFRPASLAAFRAAYPKGRNFVVSPRRAAPVTRGENGIEVTHIGLDRLRALLA
jgi:predicted AAA+ superfamily ATPase